MKRLAFFFFIVLGMGACSPNLDPVDPDRTFSHAAELVEVIGPRPAGSEGSLVAGQYILDAFELFGLEDAHFQDFTAGTLACRNVVATLAGTSYPDAVLLLGAHYDSIPLGAGSADNATGVATLLEIARYFGENPPTYTLRFVAFDAEEIGLLGSAFYYEQSVMSGELADTFMMLNLDVTDTNDSLPYCPLVTFILTTHPPATQAFERAKETMMPNSSLVLPVAPELVRALFGGGFQSDIHHWRDEPILLAWPQAFGETYHTVPGALSEIDKTGLALSTKMILEFLRALQDLAPEELQVGSPLLDEALVVGFRRLQPEQTEDRGRDVAQPRPLQIGPQIVLS